MLSLLGSLVLAATVAQAASNTQDPRAVVRAAVQAVQGDSAARLDARLRARIAREPNDRAALLGLATLARLRYDYPAAEGTYHRLLAQPNDRYAAYARLGIAQGLEERGMSGASRQEFEQARVVARQMADHIAEGEALIGLSFIRGRLEGVRVAEALLDTASRLVPDSILDAWSYLRNHLAITNALHGRAADASREAQAAVDLARRARDPRAEADAFRVTGQVLRYRGQVDSALVALRRSEDLYHRAHDRSALANSLVWHAEVFGQLGRFGEEREVMQRALAEGKATNNPRAQADAHRAFGVVAQMLGDWPSAATHLRESTAISAASGDSSGVMITRKFLANAALATGDLAAAKRLTLDLLASARSAGDARDQYELWRLLAGIAMRERDWAAADRALASARVVLPALPGANYRVWITHDEARLALARGDFASAERLLRTYISAQMDLRIGLTLFDARVRLGDVYARRGDVASAEHELETAAQDFEGWRSKLTDAELRTLAFQAAATNFAGATEPAAAASATARVFAAMVSAGRTEAAFSLVERWRARELVDRLTRIATLRVGEPVPSQATPTARSAADVVAGIPDDRTALVEYVVADGAPITVFVIQRSGIVARVLPPFDSLAASVRRFTALVEGGAEAAPFGRRLGSTLVDSALAVLSPRVTRIIVIPDGPLHRLPFDALRSGDGKYLLERYAFGYAPSASALLTLRSRQARPATGAPIRLLALGDAAVGPMLGDTAGAATSEYLAAARAAGGLGRLTGAAREARIVARYAPSADVRVGRDASAAFLRHADLRGYRVLHFATHAVADERSVARTALALTPGNGESGFVGAGDLAALRLNADLVVLSACRSAGGVVVGGEGMQGLTAPLLAAGARSLVATQWRINDREVVPFVEAFYAALASGQPVIEALRTAKLRALREGRSPRAWAAFSVIGDPLVTIPLRTPAVHWWSSFGR